MKVKHIGLLSAATTLAAVAAFGSLVSLSSAASGGPTVTLSSSTASSTSSTSIPVTATFSQAVNGLTSANITATNATVSTVTGSSTTFSFMLTPVSAGPVTVMIGADVASSTASSTGNQASNTLVFTYTPTATSTATSSSQTAFLGLSSYSGAAGSSFNALGSNFVSGESVAVAFAGATTTATADSSGNFTLPVNVPTSLPIGPAAISAMGQTSGRMATNSFFVDSTASTSTPSGTGSSTPLALTGTDTVRGNATADGTFANGWEWVLHLTVPNTETHFAMKFGDFTSSSSSSIIPAMNNIRIWSPQSQTASSSSAALTEHGNGYSSDMMLVGDNSSSTPGRQIDVHVMVAVPMSTQAGTYSTTFGALSTTTPF